MPTTQVAAGDVLTAKYQLHDVPADRAVIVPWNATGWKYRQIGPTDASDYSSPMYDDTAWSLGQAPFGMDNQGGHLLDAWGGYSTPWSLDTRLWLRRTLGSLPTGVLVATVYVRIDNFCDIYWNGTLLGSFSHVTGTPEDYSNPYNVTVPSALVDATNVLALRYTDDTTPASIDACFADC